MKLLDGAPMTGKSASRMEIALFGVPESAKQMTAIGTKRTCPSRRSIVRFRGKADIYSDVG
jgi:hypothetical protein